MGWGGIANLPPGFDVFAGREGQVNLVDEVVKGHVPGLSPSQEELFRDLKRHLLHRDYARYFDTTVVCAEMLIDHEQGKYRAGVYRDVLNPSIQVAREQFDSVLADMRRYAAMHRRPEYDPYSSLEQLHRRSAPIAQRFPETEGANALEGHYQEVVRDVRAALGSGDAPP